MDDHKPLPVEGYRAQPQDRIDLVNEMKAAEAGLLKRIAELPMDTAENARWRSIARTHFQQGFMAINRALFRPNGE